MSNSAKIFICNIFAFYSLTCHLDSLEYIRRSGIAGSYASIFLALKDLPVTV